MTDRLDGSGGVPAAHLLDHNWPLLDRFPALAPLPRIELRNGPTPVERLDAVAPNLWIKRDDLTACPIGGNKVRSLEFLLGGVRPGARVATVGSLGSTHALATAVYAKALGAEVSIGVWPQEMNPIAGLVSTELRRVALERKEFSNAVFAMAWLAWRSFRGDRTVPAGGTSALGILGHVNAALELAEQIRSGLLPAPAQVVVPLGSGGTIAGLALGFTIAGMHPVILAARVVPKVVGRRSRVLRLARKTRELIERHTSERLPRTISTEIRVIDTVYGGAYGRALTRAAEPEARLRAATGIVLDGTYSAKALTAALEAGVSAPTLFWLTFDSRWIVDDHAGS